MAYQMKVEEIPDELLVKVDTHEYLLIRTTSNKWLYFYKSNVHKQNNSIGTIDGGELARKITDGRHKVIGIVKEEDRVLPRGWTWVQCSFAKRLVIYKQPNRRGSSSSPGGGEARPMGPG
jgi:hypothetical protein